MTRALIALAVAVVGVCGCGRIGFDPYGTSGGGNSDGGDDGDGGGGTNDGSMGGEVSSGHTEGTSSSLGVTVGTAVLANDVIVVSVGWHDITSNIVSVTDSIGNTYTAATIHRGATSVSQNVYWTFSAAGAGDTVTVTFSQAVQQGSVRVVVFRGVNTGSALMPQGTNGTGNAAAMIDVVPAVSTRALLTETATAAASGPGANFTVILTTAYNDIVEYKLATTTGIQTFTTPLATNCEWVIHTIMLPPP